MKICMIFPDKDTNCSPQSQTSHLGVAYVSSYLKQYGYDVDLFDCPAMNITMNKLTDILINTAYTAVGFSAYQDNYVYVLRIATYIKRKNRDAFIFVGGYLPTLSYDKLENDLALIDCMIIGEGELIALDLMRNLEKGNWQQTKGIAFKSKKEIIYTGKGKAINNLDDIPFPQRMEKYKENINMIASRGCRGNCSFCSIISFSKTNDCKRIRRRSPENVIAEINYVIKKINPPIINFYDENFIPSYRENSTWFDEFYEKMSKKHLTTKFNCQLRADEVIKNMNNIMKFQEIGLVGVFVGIESLIQRHLDYYNKNTTVETNIQAIKYLETTNLTVRIGYMLFNPIITLEEILETINIFKKHNFNKNKIICDNLLSACTLISYPGTSIAESIKNNNYCNNERGYKIADFSCELCYQVMTRWNYAIQEMVKPISEKIYISKKYEPVMADLFSIDLSFLELVTTYLMNNKNVKLSDFEPMIKKWSLYIKYKVKKVK